MCANDVLKSYHGRKIVQIESWRIMDLNQYIGSMNAKDCIYQNPKPAQNHLNKVQNHLHCHELICVLPRILDMGSEATIAPKGPLERAWVHNYY